MAVYLIGFAVSVLLIALSEKKNIKLFIICSVLALLIPCLIAAFRSEEIGTDVQVYVIPLSDAANSASSVGDYLADYWSIGYRNQYISDYEMGFSLMLYFVIKLTKSVPAVLFLIQALIVVPIYIALARNRKKAPVWLGMLVFYLLFYNATLNMMRQWIALAFLLLAFQLLTERKYVSGLIFTVISYLFHYSAILILPIYLVYFLLRIQRSVTFQQGNFRITGRTMTVLFIAIVAMVAVINLDWVVSLMSAIGIDRFSNYLQGEQLTLLVNQILLRLPPILLLIWNWKPLRKSNPAATFYLAMLLLDVVAAQLISVDVYAFRIGHYFLMYLILAAPAMYACRKPGFERKLTVILLIGYCIFYWYYTFVLQLRHETYPYVFSF